MLSAWAQYRSKLNVAPNLLTLDHHTDTSKPFRNYLKLNPNESEANLLAKIDYKNSSSIVGAIEKLSNDEHVVTAIKSDIISSAFVIAHNARDTDLDVYSEHKIECRSVGTKQSDLVLESDFLEEKISSFDNFSIDRPFIFDIDLDYFNTSKSVLPNDSTYFKKDWAYHDCY